MFSQLIQNGKAMDDLVPFFSNLISYHSWPAYSFYSSYFLRSIHYLLYVMSHMPYHEKHGQLHLLFLGLAFPRLMLHHGLVSAKMSFFSRRTVRLLYSQHCPNYKVIWPNPLSCCIFIPLLLSTLHFIYTHTCISFNFLLLVVSLT
jgi:hypothetical protein